MSFSKAPLATARGAVSEAQVDKFLRRNQRFS
jgi:hypothetical protein